MLWETVKGICPFVPSKDFEQAAKFYKELGFECKSEDDSVRYFQMGNFGFLLQDFYVKEWAGNFMMNIHVDDVDRWYKHILSLNITEKYKGTRFTEPKLEDWGMIVMHLVDPTGVLWHITQNPGAAL